MEKLLYSRIHKLKQQELNQQAYCGTLIKKFAEITRTGMPDYVVLIQKVEREDEWIHVTHDNIDDEFHQWTRFASPLLGNRQGIA